MEDKTPELPHLSVEFFVWLWYASERDGGTMDLGDPDGGGAGVWGGGGGGGRAGSPAVDPPPELLHAAARTTTINRVAKVPRMSAEPRPNTQDIARRG